MIHERKKTKEMYILSFDEAVKKGCSYSTLGVSFFWNDVIMLSESTIFRNCTVVKTTFSEFTINEQFDVMDSEWQSYLNRTSLGITKGEYD